MNTAPRYAPHEYRVLLRVSRRRHLLVEGTSDKAFFRALIDEMTYAGSADASLATVDIDTAESLISFVPPVGNREKVEIICQSVVGEECSDRLVGFVDREYRGFALDGRLADEIGDHLVLGRLVWSRGHSVENYYFDFDVIRGPLRDLCGSDRASQALLLFGQLIESAITVACAIGLTARRFGHADAVEKCIDLSVFSPEGGNLCLDRSKWRDKLTVHTPMSADEVDEFINAFDSALAVLEGVDADVKRWLCHGHIGLRFLWVAFACCVRRCTPGYDQRRAAARALRADAAMRFDACAGALARAALSSKAVAPLQAIRLLAAVT